MMDEKLLINSAINYQEGAVVSKELANNKGGTVTLFAFDKGQGLSEHSAPYDALVIITEGKAQIFIDKQEHKLLAGEMITMPANKTHSLNALESFKMILIMLRSE